MNLEQMKKKLAEIASKLEVFAGIETLTDENLSEIEALNAEAEGLTRQIEAKEKIAAMTATVSKSAPKTQSPVSVEVKPSRKEKLGGFDSTGDFFKAVRNASMGKIDDRFKNTMFEKNGEEGGFLLPEEMSNEIIKKVQGDESLLAKTKQFTISSNNLTLNIDKNNPWGGIKAYWLAEGAQFTQTQHSFSQASFKLNKLGCIITATDELLEDARALESYINTMAPLAFVQAINESIISGNGVGKPQGILNSGFKYKVAKEGGQAADTIVAKNIIKMYSRMLPASRGNAVWLINAACEEQLRMMKDDNDNYIYLAPGSQLNQGPYALLLGRPVIPMIGSMKELGTEGDICFVDFSYYMSVLKSQGLNSAMSQHIYFDQQLSAFRFSFRIDGKCPFDAPISTQNGAYQMSAIITLEDR